jgi:hypothetical protein
MKCKKRGCKASALKDDKFCFFHSQKPDIIVKRRLARSRGGRNYKIHKEPVAINSLKDIQAILVEALNETRSSGTENTVAKYRTIAYICLILANVQDRIDLERRVEAMENSFMMTT